MADTDDRAPADLVIRTPFLAALTEWVRSVIAGVIILGGLLIIILDVSYKRIDVPNIITVMVGLMSGVLGYYFGKSGVDNANTTAAKAIQAREILETRAEDAIGQLRQDYQKQNELLNRILEDVEHSTDKALIRRIVGRLPNNGG